MTERGTLSEYIPLVVFGAGGFVGSHLRRAVAGWSAGVTVISRRSLDVGPGERLVRGDLLAPDAVSPDLPAGAVVVNLAYDATADRAASLALAAGLARVCAATKAARLVHVSTAMVAGVVADRLVTEATVCRPVTPYQRVKLEVEAHLRERVAGVCPLVVLRPTAVFGAGGLNLRKLASDLRRAPFALNYLRSSLFGHRPLNLVPVETVAAAVRFAAASDWTAGYDLFLVADDEAPTNNFRDVELVLRSGLGLGQSRLPRIPAPPAVLAALLRVTGRLASDPRTTFSTAKLDGAGFVRPVAFADALNAYVAGLRDAPPGAPV